MTLTDFLTTLAAEKGVPKEAVNDLLPRLQKFITLNVLTELALKNRALLVKFQSIAKGATSPDTIRAFVEKELPDGNVFLAKTLNDFKTLYFGS